MTTSKEADTQVPVDVPVFEVAPGTPPELAPYQFKAGEERTRAIAMKGSLAAADARLVLKKLREEGQGGYLQALMRVEEIMAPRWAKLAGKLGRGEELTDAEEARMLGHLDLQMRHLARLIPQQLESDVRVQVEEAPVPFDQGLRDSIVAVGEELIRRRKVAEQESIARLPPSRAGEGSASTSGEGGEGLGSEVGGGTSAAQGDDTPPT